MTRPVVPTISRERYASDRMRTSLDHVIGKSPSSESDIRAMAVKAREQGVILFLRADLKKLPWAAREIIEAEAARLYGKPGK